VKPMKIGRASGARQRRFENLLRRY